MLHAGCCTLGGSNHPEEVVRSRMLGYVDTFYVVTDHAVCAMHALWQVGAQKEQRRSGPE